MTIVQKCMAIICIIITEEDLCKKHAKKCAKICQFSSLPSKCFQAVNDPNTENDSRPHICAYNYNTRTGFQDHKKIRGSRVLSSTLMTQVSGSKIWQTERSCMCCQVTHVTRDTSPPGDTSLVTRVRPDGPRAAGDGGEGGHGGAVLPQGGL